MRIWVVRVAVAVLVLALGIAVGAGPLQQDNDRRARELEVQRQRVAERDLRVADLQEAGRFTDAYVSATAGNVLRGALAGRAVTVVLLPGGDPRKAAELGSLIGLAGGAVTGTVVLTSGLVAAEKRQLVEALTSQMATQSKLAMPTGANGYQRFGALLARGIGVPPAAKVPRAPYDPVAVSLLAGFGTAELVGGRSVSARAALVLVVSGTSNGEGGDGVLATVLRSLATQVPAVVTGPRSAATGSGLLAQLRGATGAPGMSTVDGVDGPVGKVTAVLALAARARGVVGAYGGTASATAAIPPAP